MSKLANKVAVVTGASKGIGAAIAKALAADSASVVVNYASSKEGADAVVDAIAKAGGRAVAVGGSVAKAAEAQGIIDAAIQHFGKVDVLVNNAGVYKMMPLEGITEEEFRRQFDTNVLGLLLVTQAAAKHMTEGGSVINIGSVAGRTGFPANAVYSATKAGVDMITSVLAKELGSRKIRVNSLNPGLVETEGTAEMINPELEQMVVSMTPLGRVGQTGDVASVAVFLASDDSGWMTGERLYVSGGA
ncbi:MAG: glucose 1-dehydrogenase [Rhodospirillales bacterium]|nr:glucose 1-dehydrogenase [Acetobacter sp.]